MVQQVHLIRFSCPSLIRIDWASETTIDIPGGFVNTIGNGPEGSCSKTCELALTGVGSEVPVSTHISLRRVGFVVQSNAIADWHLRDWT